MNHARIIPNNPLNKTPWLAGALAFVLILLVLPSPAFALVDDLMEYTAAIVGSIAEMVANLLGILMLKVVHVLVGWIAPYNNFVGFDRSRTGELHPVEVGWTVVRDFTNMFFIVILLVIAFGTMLRAKGYDYRERLPKLLVMAILINFSRTIIAFVIDAAQVVMLTFVNAFQSAAGGNFVVGLGIHKLFEIPEGAGAVDSFTAVVSFILADVFLAIALMTVVVITVTMAARIVMLWMITILSPVAFLMSTFERGTKYYGMWWDQLICWVGSGPILAFFLWLALATMIAGGNDIANVTRNVPVGEGREFTSQPFVTEAAKEQNIVRFIVGIMMLMVGLQVSQEFCAIGAGMAKGLGKMIGGAAVAGGLGLAAYGPKKLWAGAKAAPGKLWTGAKGVGGWADYNLGVRKKLYGSRVAQYMAPNFANQQLEKMRAASEGKYEERLKTQKAAAAVNPNAARYAADRALLRPRGTSTADTDAQDAAALEAVLTNSKVYDQMVTDKGKDYADQQRRSWFEQHEKVSSRSGSQKIQDGRKKVRKQNVHLIQDEQERLKVARSLTAADVEGLSADAISDPIVYSGLSEGVKKSIREGKGDADQQAALGAAESQQKIVQNIKVDGLDRYIAQHGTDTAKKNITAYLEKGPAGERLIDREDVMRAVMEKGLIDPKQLQASQLSANNGALAAMFAQHGSSELLAGVAQNKNARGGMVAGLEQHRATNPNLSAPEQQRIAEVMFVSGASRGSAFQNEAQFVQAMAGDRSETIVGAIDEKEFKKDKTYRDMVAENAKPEDLFLLARGSDQEKGVAKAVKDAMRERSREEDATAAIVKGRLDDIESSVNSRLLLGRVEDRMAKRRQRKQGRGGNT